MPHGPSPPRYMLFPVYPLSNRMHRVQREERWHGSYAQEWKSGIISAGGYVLQRDPEYDRQRQHGPSRIVGRNGGRRLRRYAYRKRGEKGAGACDASGSPQNVREYSVRRESEKCRRPIGQPDYPLADAAADRRALPQSLRYQSVIQLRSSKTNIRNDVRVSGLQGPRRSIFQ